MTIVYALLAGFVFGIGLLLSGLADPSKVLAFLDLGGNWDPSLLFVMGGALLVAAPAFAWLARRGRTLDGALLHLPAKGRIDRRLGSGRLLPRPGTGVAQLGRPGAAAVRGRDGGGHGLIRAA